MLLIFTNNTNTHDLNRKHSLHFHHSVLVQYTRPIKQSKLLCWTDIIWCSSNGTQSCTNIWSMMLAFLNGVPKLYISYHYAKNPTNITTFVVVPSLTYISISYQFLFPIDQTDIIAFMVVHNLIYKYFISVFIPKNTTDISVFIFPKSHWHHSRYGCAQSDL